MARGAVALYFTVVGRGGVVAGSSLRRSCTDTDCENRKEEKHGFKYFCLF